MKIRQSFVSNSSSCSFVLGKYFMTDEQVEKFRKFKDLLEKGEETEYFSELLEYASPEIHTALKGEDIRYEDGHVPFEGKYYFFGKIDQTMESPIKKFLEEIGINMKYVECIM